MQDGSFCYLASLQDGCSLTIVGHAVADHMREELTLTALGQALNRRNPAPGPIVHSDGGNQYVRLLIADGSRSLGIGPK